jgi:hypothetical protein
MAIGMLMEIPGGTQEQYDRTMEILDLGGQLPEGGISHVAGPMAGGWRVVDVWESQEAFQRFFDERLGAAIREAGVPPADPEFFPVHYRMPE